MPVPDPLPQSCPQALGHPCATLCGDAFVPHRSLWAVRSLCLEQGWQKQGLLAVPRTVLAPAAPWPLWTHQGCAQPCPAEMCCEECQQCPAPWVCPGAVPCPHIHH